MSEAGSPSGAKVATAIPRSGPAIRAALMQSSPDECDQFEAEFQAAAKIAGKSFDLAPLDAILERWWRIANVRAHPLTDDEKALLARFRAGDERGLYVREAVGWRQL